MGADQAARVIDVAAERGVPNIESARVEDNGVVAVIRAERYTHA